MKTNFFILLTVAFIINNQCSAGNEDINKLFEKAESYFNDEKYSLALPLYIEVESTNYETANINFKIGVCYLFSQSEKAKAVTYLLKAAKSTSAKTKETSFKEK